MYRPMRAPTLLLAVAVAALLTLACGSESGPGDDGGGPPPPDTITMEPNATPTYGWQLGNADTVEVARTADLATPVWRTVSTDLDGIGPGLTHGTTGAGRNVTVTTETVLTGGISYRVRIVRQTGGSVVMKTFTVQP
jgi:hypothetical protein